MDSKPIEEQFQDQQISDKMVEYYHERRDLLDVDLDFLPFIKESPNAYLLGVIYNQGMSADHTWTIPEKLMSRLGHFDIYKIAETDIEVLEEVFGTTPALHRYKNTMASHTKRAAQLLVSKYGGNAQNIWNDKPDVETLYARLNEFKGMGPKKINMTIRALALFYGVDLANPEKIDLPVDIHVRRVLMRTGIVDEDSTPQMVLAARKLNPSLPAELDLPLWLIGRRWCHATDPNCAECPIRDVCRQLTNRSVES
jgi:uncharacterized HhH-GPD family protein